MVKVLRLPSVRSQRGSFAEPDCKEYILLSACEDPTKAFEVLQLLPSFPQECDTLDASWVVAVARKRDEYIGVIYDPDTARFGKVLFETRDHHKIDLDVLSHCRYVFWDTTESATLVEPWVFEERAGWPAMHRVSCTSPHFVYEGGETIDELYLPNAEYVAFPYSGFSDLPEGQVSLRKVFAPKLTTLAAYNCDPQGMNFPLLKHLAIGSFSRPPDSAEILPRLSGLVPCLEALFRTRRVVMVASPYENMGMPDQVKAALGVDALSVGEAPGADYDLFFYYDPDAAIASGFFEENHIESE